MPPTGRGGIQHVTLLHIDFSVCFGSIKLHFFLLDAVHTELEDTSHAEPHVANNSTVS